MIHSPYDVATVAFIGLPNSGKSTLLNRFTRSKKAIVAREAHTTRDVNFGQDFFDGYHIRFVDTGGLVPDPDDRIQKEVQIKSWLAITEADLLVWVIDRKQDPMTIHQDILQRVWKTGKPFIVAINKVDDPNQDRSLAEYAFIGGKHFINMSCNTGYGLNELMDAITEELQLLRFQPNFEEEFEVEQRQKQVREKTKEVRKAKDGSYYIVRDEENLFTSVDSEGAEFVASAETIEEPTQALVFDLFGVVFKNKQFEIEQSVVDFIIFQKSQAKKLYYLSNCSQEVIQKLEELNILRFFDGGLASFQSTYQKPEPEFFHELCEKYDLKPEKCIYFDDQKTNVDTAREIGFQAALFASEKSIWETFELAQNPNFEVPRVIFIGKPNVGKSSLFNALHGSSLQIVTDIAGTTMSVNDTLIQREQKQEVLVEFDQDGEMYTEKFTISRQQQYLLLDSVGLRRPGQRTFGAEHFGSYRTIQTAHQSDVICLVFDASTSLSHQDQVVAGIAKEARKGLVVIFNKADKLGPKERNVYVKQFESRFNFLKVQFYVWLSAKEALETTSPESGSIADVNQIWPMVDAALEDRKLEIPRTRLRKLFNYLVKKKPPSKQRTKKRPILYDLWYTRKTPPTFELIVKDPRTVHWSYVRFLENIIRQNFGFEHTEIVVKLTKADQKNIVAY